MTQSQQAVEELYDCYTKTAANIIAYYDGDERKNKLKELRDIVENNCVQDKKLKSAANVRDRLLDLRNDDDDDDDEEEADIETMKQEYERAISQLDTNASNDNKLLQFDRHVEALLDRVNTEDNNEDEEMQLTGGFINVIDPISKKRIVDPVKNSVCGHTYDRESITEILKINKKTRCPVIGCRSVEFVTLSNLRTDIVMKTYLDKNTV